MQEAKINSIISEIKAEQHDLGNDASMRWGDSLLATQIFGVSEDEHGFARKLNPIQHFALGLTCFSVILPTSIGFAAPRAQATQIAAPQAMVRTYYEITSINPYDLIKYSYQHSKPDRAILDDLIDKIEAIADFEEGWDGYRAPSIGRKVIDDAVTFIKSIPAEIPLPSISPTPDKEILMVWEKSDDVLMVSVFGEATFHAYSLIQGKETFFEAEPIRLTSMSDELIEIARTFC